MAHLLRSPVANAAFPPPIPTRHGVIDEAEKPLNREYRDLVECFGKEGLVAIAAMSRPIGVYMARQKGQEAELLIRELMAISRSDIGRCRQRTQNGAAYPYSGVRPGIACIRLATKGNPEACHI